ncbi:3-dehydroquinate synthase [Pontibacter cellulosilyticus]|uniref:3-dehydroquinate synthase n=1 Tax=Pontibacter cellulosilyticus TaxID=1720253 RepID=A0A923N332_9BACT|nr:3-dehydroquinate synthase [Pontibacter cellulosilyticus]MBC5991264.1 3-dehydroquinate synthase [Pontibacter cellulosilyticus]
MNQTIEQEFTVKFRYGVYFTQSLFATDNTLLTDILKQSHAAGTPAKLLVVLDSGVANTHPDLLQQIRDFALSNTESINLVAEPLLIPGGEESKNNPVYLQQILQAVNEFGVCRHSYLLAIGGGAVLDLAGFVATIAHRGIRHIRIPTTVLSQNDSGVGVKNSINSFGKKNFIGTFAPPVAVINDSNFLLTLDDRDWRSGISEAIKVALIKDAAFYQSIKRDAVKLANRDMEAMQRLIHRCAKLHVQHIGGADPFETGSSRPLDFGHWSAHKLEQLSNYNLRHGEAVAIGIALDVTYSCLKGMITQAECNDVLNVLRILGFELFTPELLHQNEPFSQLSILNGLKEFQEHLGGQLTIMLLQSIGKGVEVHHMDELLLLKAIQMLHINHQPQILAQA